MSELRVVADTRKRHRIKPKARMTLSMSPYLPIEKDADGHGGGIRLRVYGDDGAPNYVDVVWGATTEIEVLA